MRDKLKNKAYFDKMINTFNESIETQLNWIDIGITPQERINFVKRGIVQDYICLIQCKYSNNYDLYSLKEDLQKCIKICNESWDGFWLVEYNCKKLRQYGESYDEMLWMLSISYLLDLSEADFEKLAEVIDRDKVKDNLFEFIIRTKLKDRKPITEESYQEFFGVPHTFEKLRLAINETDKTKAEKLVQEFITKDWYTNHKDAGWYNSHKSKHDVYCGYWSFETAAVVKIMGLEDSSFIDCQYYPKDLVLFETE